MKRVKTKTRIKWWRLKKEELCFGEELRQALCGRDELPDDWGSTAEVVKETATKMFVLSAGQRKKGHLMESVIVREKKKVDGSPTF